MALGLRSTGLIEGTGSINNPIVTEGRPKNWREGILRLYPNGAAALTAFLALVDSEPSSDPDFNWWEKQLPQREAILSGAQTAAATNLVLTGAAGIIYRSPYIVFNPRTGEKMKVTADQASAAGVTVSRGFGETAAAAINDQDVLRVIGNANEEGAGISNPITYDPVKKFNYTQIFRTPLAVTRTAKKTRLRTEDAKRTDKIEALELQSIDMEFAFIWGERLETAGALGNPLRTTRGIVQYVDVEANANDSTTNNGNLNETKLLTALEPIFRFGSVEKLTLAGSTALNVMTQIAKGGSQLWLDNGTEVVYGVRLRRFMTAFGDLLIRQHPLFNLYATGGSNGAWRQSALIIDLAHIRYRYIDDLMYLRDRQSPGTDASQDEFLAECGLEQHFGAAHGIIRNITAFGA